MSSRPEEERDFLLASIRDLDAEHAAGDIEDADYEALRRDYTARAADVLRRLEPPPARRTVRAAPRPSPGTTDASPARGRGKAVAAAFGVALLAVGAGFAVSQSAGERMAGDEVTGSIELSSIDRITRAQLLVSEGRILDAIKLYDEVLKEDPTNPVALAQRGWLLHQVGLPEAMRYLDAAVAADPGYADAYFFRGMVRLNQGDAAAAIREFDTGLAKEPAPPVRAGLEQGRSRALAAAAAAPAG